MIYYNPSFRFIAILNIVFSFFLLRGLAHMHKNGVVHGDVKPHNIMWSGLEETFKLIDFGVSFSLNENMEHAIQSRGNNDNGTLLLFSLWSVFFIFLHP